MCDYSLHSIKNRLAVEGEVLVVSRFYTGSKGLASAADVEWLQNLMKSSENANFWARLKARINGSMGRLAKSDGKSLCAVCVPPGARLSVSGLPPRLQKEYGLSESEEVTFVELTAEPFRYRDALRFDNGQEVLIQRLNDGLQLEVVRLSLSTERPKVWRTSDLRLELNAVEQSVY